MTIREDEETSQPYNMDTSSKFLIDAVVSYGNCMVTLGAALIIISPLPISLPSPGNTAAYAAIGFLAGGMFSCSVGIACKIASCYAEDDDGYQPLAVEMV